MMMFWPWPESSAMIIRDSIEVLLEPSQFWVGRWKKVSSWLKQAGGRGIVDPQPHHRKRDAGGNGGQVVHGLKDRLQLLFKGHDKDGHREGDQQRKRTTTAVLDQRIFGDFQNRALVKVVW